ncbi:MAG: hypothetical protein OEV44_06550, partial [Spirochaetota bacterium]|nr:hypothetical protein [Spirochaetota bacterium]
MNINQPFKLITPVLLIIFNRPDTTQKVFNEIRKAKPTKLFVTADGPRSHITEDKEKCQLARDIIKQVDWDCELHTNFSDTNLGCQKGPYSGINWFFSHVEEGIILEDDCVPGESFFGFCEIMLEKYRNDQRIMMISGSNFTNCNNKNKESYFFSNYYNIWGWATWKRAWKLYDVTMKDWKQLKNDKQIYWLFSNLKIAFYYECMFDLIYDGFDAWDIQWWFACIFNNSLAIVPSNNLISNIGIEGTHSVTQSDVCIGKQTYRIDITNIVHPKYVTPDIKMNQLTYKHSHASIEMENIYRFNISYCRRIYNIFYQILIIKTRVYKIKLY